MTDEDVIDMVLDPSRATPRDEVGSGPADASEYLLTREAAALLRTPESTLRYWRHIRTGPPHVKVGRRVLYRREAVLAWLREREQATSLIPCPRDPSGAIAARVRRRTPPARRRST